MAVSSAGCHDNRMDKAVWNEQWMGWPVGPHYAAQSNYTLAPNLVGKLLLAHGELDENGPGPPATFARPQRSPQYINFLWRFCMGAQGA